MDQVGLNNKYGLPHITPDLDTLEGQWRIPRIVYYMWCGSGGRVFTYEHFLSMRSTIAFLAPDVIYFLYDTMPVLDKLEYHTWFEELKDQYPFLHMVNVSSNHYCQSSETHSYGLIYEEVRKTGGIFVKENTVFTQIPHKLSQKASVWAMNEQGTAGFFAVTVNSTHRDVETFKQRADMKMFCRKDTLNQGALNDVICMYFSRVAIWHPVNIWSTDGGKFHTLARKLTYGHPGFLRPEPRPGQQIPKIVHYIWFGGRDIDFLFYLSILSSLNVLGARVYVHGDGPISGPFWEKFADDSRVNYVYRRRSDAIFGTELRTIYHKADVANLEIMLQYGGVTVDHDLLFTRPLPDTFWHYDAIATTSYISNNPYPNRLNWGLKFAKRNSYFWRLVQRSQYQFRVFEFTTNSAVIPYKIYERHPHMVRVEPRLQVICHHLVCHPMWIKDNYERAEASKNVEQWIDQAYSFHFTKPTPEELLSIDAIVTGEGAFAEIGKIVLRASGLL